MRPKLEGFNVQTANAVDKAVSEGTHQTAWLCIVVVYIRKTQFSRDEAHFSVSYEMNDRKKLSQHVFERIMIRFSSEKHLNGEQIIFPFFNLLFLI